MNTSDGSGVGALSLAGPEANHRAGTRRSATSIIKGSRNRQPVPPLTGLVSDAISVQGAFNMITDRIYLRWCLVVPPLFHLLVGIIPNRLDGLMAASLYYGGIPYVVWATFMFVQVGRGSSSRLRRMVAIAPLTYLAVFLVNFVLVGLVTTPRREWSGVIPEVVGGFAFLSPFVVLLGYLWVGLALLGWRFRRRVVGELANQAE